MGKKSINMCEGPLLGPMIWYTVPIALSGVLQLLFSAADMAVVGHFCGSISVAAVGATGALINLIVALFMSLSVGAGVLVGQAVGANFKNSKADAISRIVHTAIAVSFITGIILTFVGLMISRSFLEMMGTPDDVINLSALYMKIYFCGSAPLLVYNFGSAILRALGDSKRPLIYLTLSGIINVILNIVFVMGLKMNVDGVALATVISQTISAVLVVIALMRRNDECRLFIKKLRIYKKELWGMIKIGFPAGVQSLVFSVSNVIIQSSVNSFGKFAMSGHAAAGNIDGFVYIIMNSFYQTALNFTAQNYGAGNYNRIKKISYTSLISVSVSGIVTGIIVYIFATPLLSIYITDSAESIHYGIVRIAYLCLPYFICGCMEVATGVIRGMGTSVLPMLVSIFGVCGIRIVWIYTVFKSPKYHSMESLYASYPISWLITFLILFIVLSVLINKLKKRKISEL